ncbi:ATPase [Sesbania bispinosa]|nr:ATPase [Sesbania bispinosa]
MRSRGTGIAARGRCLTRLLQKRAFPVFVIAVAGDIHGAPPSLYFTVNSLTFILQANIIDQFAKK